MPACENEHGVVVFLQVASKFGVRYATLGFQDTAQLDDGTIWPTSYAVSELDKGTEARIRGLIRKAAPEGP